MTARVGVTVTPGDTSQSPRVTCMDFSSSSTAPVPRLTLTTEFLLGAKQSSQNATHENFLTDVRWSPDGVCLLTVGAEDATFRVYDVPGDELMDGSRGDEEYKQNEIEVENVGSISQSENSIDSQNKKDNLNPDALWPALRIKSGETVRDYAWFPRMNAHELSSCVFASAAKSQPVHLHDAVTGKIRASFCERNRLDEPVDFNALCFSGDGGSIFAGAFDAITVWDVGRPGYTGNSLWRREKNGHSNQSTFKGLVTDLQCAPVGCSTSSMLAAGSTAGVVGVFHQNTGEPLFTFTGHKDGITRVQWSPCGTYLYSAARKDDSIMCWDVRNSSSSQGTVYTMRRNSSSTNQKIGFDVEPSGRHLVSGGCDGVLRAFDLRDGTERAAWAGAGDTVSDFSFHPLASWSWSGGRNCQKNQNKNAHANRGASVSGHRRFHTGLGDEQGVPSGTLNTRTHQNEGTVCALRVWEYSGREMEEGER